MLLRGYSLALRTLELRGGSAVFCGAGNKYILSIERAGLRNQDTGSTWRLRTWRIPEASGWRTQYGPAARVGLFDSGVGREGE
jgi:hypothetical protein